jgi:hypothetical protein
MTDKKSLAEQFFDFGTSKQLPEATKWERAIEYATVRCPHCKQEHVVQQLLPKRLPQKWVKVVIAKNSKRSAT